MDQALLRFYYVRPELLRNSGLPGIERAAIALEIQCIRKGLTTLECDKPRDSHGHFYSDNGAQCPHSSKSVGDSTELSETQKSIAMQIDKAFSENKGKVFYFKYATIKIKSEGNKYGYVHAEQKRLYVDKYSPEKMKLWRKSICQTMVSPQYKRVDANNYMLISRDIKIGDSQIRCTVCLGRVEKDKSRVFITGYFEDK